MKLVIIGILMLASQILSTPLNQGNIESVKQDDDSDFRDRIDYLYTRFQVFYDLVKDQMRDYRLNHVNQVSLHFNSHMLIAGEELDFIRASAQIVDEAIEERTNELGGVNPCLQGIIDERRSYSEVAGQGIQQCMQLVNSTMVNQLEEVFYPTFASIQDATSLVPLYVTNGLSRGNMFEEQNEIIDYLESQYQFIRAQWLTTTSQLFRWDTNRFNVEGEFSSEEFLDCIVPPTFSFMINTARLVYESKAC